MFENYSLLKSDLYCQEGKLLKPTVISQILSQKSGVGLLKYCSNEKKWFVFSDVKNIYEVVTESEIRGGISILLTQVNDSCQLSSFIVKYIVEDLKLNEYIILTREQKKQALRFIVFQNGILDMGFPDDLMPFNRKFFTLTRHEFEIHPNDLRPFDVKAPIFAKYISDLSNNDPKSLDLLRAVFKACLIPYDWRTIFIIKGSSGSGKSQFTNIIQAMIDKNFFLSTNFEQLNESRFEMANFKDKRVVLFADIQKINEKNLNLIKGATGTDNQIGRIKYQQEPIDFKFSGLVVMTTNENFEIIDPSNALTNRLKVLDTFKAVDYNQSQTDLINIFESKPFGPLAKEIGHIFIWCLFMPIERAIWAFKNSSMTASKVLVSLNHFLSFFEESPESISIGLADREYEEPTMFNFFTEYCEIQKNQKYSSVKKTNFLRLLKSCLIEYYSEKVQITRRNHGMVIVGLKRSQKVFSKEFDSMKPERSFLETLNSDFLISPIQEELKNLPFFSTISKESIVNPNLFLLQSFNSLNSIAQIDKQGSSDGFKNLKNYLFLFKVTQEKKEIINSLNLRPKSDELFESKSNAIANNLAFVNQYKFSKRQALSGQRIYPVNHTKTIHNFSKVDRDLFFFEKNCQLKTHKFLDIDIESCFLSIMFGLFPEEAEDFNFEESFWIQLENKSRNKLNNHLFDKKTVKLAIYIYAFGGNKTTFLRQLLKNIEKAENGGTETPNFLKKKGIIFWRFIEETLIFQYLDKIKERIIKEDRFNKSAIHGVNYFTEKDLTSSYSKSKQVCFFLQELEIAILSNTILECCKKREIIPCCHMHDGLIICLKIPFNIIEISNLLNSELAKQSSNFGIKRALKFKIVEF